MIAAQLATFFMIRFSRHDLPHRQDHAAQQDQVLAQFERPAVHDVQPLPVLGEERRRTAAK
jgi:hypothetical protein